MINRVFRLVDVKRIEMSQRELALTKQTVIVRPEYMAICQADLRYFLGKRKLEVLQKKLPLALIHEAMGRVLYDATGTYKIGERVVLIPNTTPDQKGIIKGNYRQDSIFRSSDTDGFMQDLIPIPANRLISLPEGDDRLYVLSEIVSVAFNAIEAFERHALTEKTKIGVWGDGSLGFVVCLVLHTLYPDSEIYIFGKNARKLQRFTFVSQSYLIDAIPKDLSLDHCFECVGSMGSEQAVHQILKMIRPQGCISLLGVSEDPIKIDTRTALAKGILFIGNSRSEKIDFQKAVQLIYSNEFVKRYLRTIISQVCVVRTIEDIYSTFEQSQIKDFKAIIKWEA